MTTALDLLKKKLPHVALAAQDRDPNKPENRVSFDSSRYGLQLPRHAQEMFWKMWYANRGADRYARLFRALGEQYGAPDGQPVLRLYIPVGEEFKESGKYSVNEAHLMNALYDLGGGQYEVRPGGYYLGVVYDTKNNRDVSIAGLLQKLGQKEHDAAARAASPADVAKQIEKLTFTSAGEVVGGKGKVNKRYTDIDLVKKTAFDNKPNDKFPKGRERPLADIAGGLLWTKIDKLKAAIDSDPVRQNAGSVDKSGMMVVISRDPIDIATLSTNRSWAGSSCLRLEYDKSGSRGGNAHYVPNMVKYGALVVYGVKCGDVQLNAPVTRTTLLPFINQKDDNDIVLLPSLRPGQKYGEPFPGFYAALYGFLDKVNGGNKGGMYRPAPFKFYTGDIGGDNQDYPVPVWSQDRDIEAELKKYGITNYVIRDDKRVDVKGDVVINLGSGGRSSMTERENIQLPIKFGKVSGNFTVSSFDPKSYDPDWYRAEKNMWNKSNFMGRSISSTNLKSMKGFPEYVGGDLCIAGLDTESLEGCPAHVGGHFIAANVRGIKNLFGGPKHVGGNYDVSYSDIVSTKGLDGAVVGRSLVLNHTKVTHMDGKAASVGLDVDLSMTELRTTMGLPDRVEGNLYIRDLRNLITLRGMPKYIGQNLSISDCNNVKDLQGLVDTEIMGDMWFNNGELTSIQYYPKRVRGDMQLKDHRLPRGTQKPPTVEGKLLLGAKEDGSDHEQKGPGNSDAAKEVLDANDLVFDLDDIFSLDKPTDEMAF